MNTCNANRPLFHRLTPIVLLAGMLVMGHVSAGPPVDARSATVNFADLDLSKPEGAAVLYRRIQAAARAVCGGNLRPRDMRDLRIPGSVIRACYDAAVANAVKQMDESNLFAVHVAAK